MLDALLSVKTLFIIEKMLQRCQCDSKNAWFVLWESIVSQCNHGRRKVFEDLELSSIDDSYKL